MGLPPEQTVVAPGTPPSAPVLALASALLLAVPDGPDFGVLGALPQADTVRSTAVAAASAQVCFLMTAPVLGRAAPRG